MSTDTWPAAVQVLAGGERRSLTPTAEQAGLEVGFAGPQAARATAPMIAIEIRFRLRDDAQCREWIEWAVGNGGRWLTCPAVGPGPVRIRDGIAGATLRRRVHAAGAVDWIGECAMEAAA